MLELDLGVQLGVESLLARVTVKCISLSARRGTPQLLLEITHVFACVISRINLLELSRLDELLAAILHLMASV